MNTESSSAFSKKAYFAIAFLSASIISYELWIMRVFSIGSWSHFGSMVISIAMFGFGVFSTVLCLSRNHFKKHFNFWISVALLIWGPVFVAANVAAQRLPFNPIFLISDPTQKYYLLGFFIFYFVPFLTGALFLGLVFLRGQENFGRVYFADMVGAGLGGLALLIASYFILPQQLFLIPLFFWILGALAWFSFQNSTRLYSPLIVSASIAIALGVFFPPIAISPYKGVSYARNFPDAKKVYQAVSPLGLMEVYSSSYFHFAPGLSDTAAIHLKKMPDHAYLGLYFDSDGPVGVMRQLTEEESEYFDYLPMAMPYLLQAQPQVLVMQFGGGVSTAVALKKNAPSVTVAEGNPMIAHALQFDSYLKKFTGNILEHPKLKLIPHDGRIFIHQTAQKYDVIDLSLADSTGLSMPGGFAIHEKYLYTQETLLAAMQALTEKGILSVTTWNKEDPPKSTLKLLATVIEAAKKAHPQEETKKHFFVAHTFLSTLTVLYKKDGFEPAEIKKLKDYCQKMSFEVVYFPGDTRTYPDRARVFQAIRDSYFNPKSESSESVEGESLNLALGQIYGIALQAWMNQDNDFVRNEYLFNTEPLTNNRPYLAGFISLKDLPHFLDKLESVTDEWGYFLLWATFLLALGFGILLLLFPMVAGWRLWFSKTRGKLGVILYFICLGIGYIFIEIAMINKYILCLSNPSISAAVLIPGMLIFSGIGSLVSERFLTRPRKTMAWVCFGSATILLLYGFALDKILYAIGGYVYPLRILFCLILLFPLAFLLGFPMALGMSTLSRLKKEHFFIWAWGINGSFSVVGSVLVPILAVSLGISSVLAISAGIYSIAFLAFFSLLLPDKK